MTRSLNEIEGMIHKAARGAGLPLGHADELAAAGVRLVAEGGDPGEITVALDKATGVAMTGPAAIDAVLATGEPVTLADVDSPHLLVAMVAAREVAVTARIESTGVVLEPGETVVLPLDGPVDVDAAHWARWSELAARTYVPASEASRESGAGAGLTDND